MPDTHQIDGAGLAPTETPIPRARRLGMLVALLFAAGLIFIGDRMLRQRQNLVGELAAKDVRVLMPFSDYLTDRIEKKNTWNTLHERIAHGLSTNNQKDFIEASYSLAEFIATEISPDDSRRRDVLQVVIDHAKNLPDAANAYWALFNPTWKPLLRSAYPRYADALMKIADAHPKEQIESLIQLSSTLKELHEDTLEVTVLRRLRNVGPVNFLTADAMRRLLSLAGTTEPDRAALEADLAQFDRHHEQLRAAAKWYATWDATGSKAPIAELERVRSLAPPGDANFFTAGADAHLVAVYLQAGRFSDARRLRASIATYKTTDVDVAESISLTEELSARADGAKTPPPAHMASHPAIPDRSIVALNRWRGLLDAGNVHDADAQAADLFPANDKVVRSAAADESALAAGMPNKVSPLAVLEKRTSNLPPELGGESEAWFASFELKPVNKSVPAELHSSAELWVGRDKMLVLCHADDPRAPLPPVTATKRDQDTYKDECFELFFDPDRWFDFYYQIDGNSAGVVSDIEHYNSTGFARRQYKPDRSFNFDIEVKPTKTASGWDLRLMLPPRQVFPDAWPAIRFNIRRLNYVQEKGKTIQHIYAWSTKPGGSEQRPEQFGWLVMPASP